MSDEIIQLTYGAKVAKQSDGYLVTFRDFDNAYTEGASMEEALFNAREVLDLIILDCLDRNLHIPYPSTFKKNEMPVAVSPDVAAPALLYMLRVSKKRSMAQIADKMGVPYQSYQRMESGKNLTMKSIKRAAHAMGAMVEIRLHKLKEV